MKKTTTKELSWAERQAYAAAHISDNPTLDEVMAVLDVVIEPEVRGKLSKEDMAEHVQGDLKPRGMYLVVPSHVYQKSATEVVAAVQIPMAYIMWVSLRKGILTGETDQVCCATPEGYFMVDRAKAMQGLVNQMRLTLEEFEFARTSEDMSGYTEPS
jgi:hypothetical protein